MLLLHNTSVLMSGSTVYRGVLISEGWSRSIQKCPHFRVLEWCDSFKPILNSGPNVVCTWSGQLPFK